MSTDHTHFDNCSGKHIGAGCIPIADYITRFRELVSPDMYRHDGTPMLAIKQENVEQFITTLATEQFEAGKAAAVDYIQSHFNDHEYAKLWGDDDAEWTDEEHEAAFSMFFGPLLESARNQKSI